MTTAVREAHPKRAEGEIPQANAGPLDVHFPDRRHIIGTGLFAALRATALMISAVIGGP